ncbi:hypothetical protein Baya_5976 [Bagarius yarrelli]|uniref:Uncharacterized protein n=1 Tax=Bagarius yarrelli TaxID=175774 RepID=A0A556U0R7_BAGYA|nr:hypothetical protein Baya_5976 [Bagarius yarrelli]
MATNSITPSSAEKQRSLGNGSELMLQGFDIPCEDSVIITGMGWEEEKRLGYVGEMEPLQRALGYPIISPGSGGSLWSFWAAF